MENKKNIFISYRRKYSFYQALKIYEILNLNDEYNVSLDLKTMKGGRFDEQLYTKIEECEFFLLIVTENTFKGCRMKKNWVRKELHHALKKEKRIIPILFDDAKFPEKLPKIIDDVRSYESIELNRNNFLSPDAIFTKLKDFMDNYPDFIDGIEYSHNGKFLIKASKGIKGRVVSIPDGVTKIGDGAFTGCTLLEEILIPDSVTYIGNSAFEGCTSLTSINIPKKIRYIGDYAFKGCMSLNTIYTLHKFYETHALALFPDSKLEIGNDAFRGCIGLKKINIPNSVTKIGKRAFYSCYELKKVTIPDSVTEIGLGAFSGCIGLTEISIPNSVTYIGDWAYEDCKGLTKVIIPDNVTEIGKNAFLDCTGLTEINFSNSVSKIGERAFEGCYGLTEINIPDSVKEIGDYAFSYCKELTKITIPNGVKIGLNAFEGCTKLK